MILFTKKHLFYLIFAILIFSLYAKTSRLKEVCNTSGQTEVIYSKNSAADQKLISTVEEADQFVYFALYTMTRLDMADALIAAKLRGLKVIGILDYNQSIIPEEKPVIKKLQSYGVPILIPEKERGLMHAKMIVTDKAYASGSFNWTFSAANYNDEVLEIGNSENIRKQYVKVFNEIYQRYK